MSDEASRPEPVNQPASTAAQDPQVRQLAEAFVRAGTNKRAVAALSAILERGAVTTAELKALGYDHPPRALRDVKEAGIPITRAFVSAGGKKRMASYTLGSVTQVRTDGRRGRAAVPKAFRRALLERYGAADTITGATMDPRALQVDHRIPYEVGGDDGLTERDVEAFMLLDGSSQRSKSWSCEHCDNFVRLRDPGVCRTCYWAFPECYDHVAMAPIRRTDVVWQGEDVEVHDALRRRAEAEGSTTAELLRRVARRHESGT